MEKFLKALGRILVYTIYFFVIVVLIGLIRWAWKAIHHSD